MGATITVRAVRRAVSESFALLVAGAVCNAPAAAGGPLTDFSWAEPAGGTFAFPPNWDPFDIFPPGTVIGPPGPGEMATFALGNSTYTVTFSTNPTNLRLRIGDDHVLFNLDGHVYTLTSTGSNSIVVGGLGFFDDALLTLTNGTLAGEAAAIAASDFGSAAHLFVGSGALLNLDGPISIGTLDHGSLTISSGGDVICSTGVIGDLAGTSGGGSGTVVISGSGSTWDVSSTLVIGDNHNGAVTISDNAHLETGGVTSLGVKPGVFGSLTIGGLLSVWDASGQIYLGGSFGGPGGTASLTVNPGGIVNVSSLPFFPNIHVRPGSSLNLLGGTLLAAIENEGGAFTWPTGVLVLRNAQAVVPGPLFTSPLTLDDAATVLSMFSLLVNNNGVINASNSAGIGGEGELKLNDGEIHLSSGADLSWTYGGLLGELPGTTGVITLDGFGTSWTHDAPISQELNIGHGGAGEVTVVAGASFMIADQCVPTLGRMDGSSGSLLISGPGSQCSVALHPLYVGSAGDGVVTIDDGAVLSAPVIILGEIDGDGEISLDGAGSSVTAGVTTVGDFGSGSLTVTAGAMLAGDCVIAQGMGSTGDALLSGRGTQLIADGINDYLIVGGAGIGSLDITDGATAQAGEVIIGDGTTAVGTLTLSGAGSQLGAEKEIFVGFSGPGALIIGSGAQVLAPLIAINSLSSVAGSGIITGDLFSSGLISPGLSAGTLSIDGACTLDSSSVLEFELAGVDAGRQHDVLAVTADIDLDGTLDVSLADGFGLDPGDQFTIIETALGAISGTFARVVAPRGIEVIYTTQAVILKMAGTSCPADLDGSGAVDGGDLGLLLADWDNPGSGDLDNSGAVDGADLGLLLAAWGSCS